MHSFVFHRGLRAGPLPERYYTVPCVVRPARQTIGLGRVLKWRPSPNTYRRVQPGEIYLKLIHTDLDDDASVEDFIGRYGMMGLHELKGRYAGRSPAHELAGDARPEPDNPLQARRWRARNALTLDRDAYKDGEESFDEFLGAGTCSETPTRSGGASTKDSTRTTSSSISSGPRSSASERFLTTSSGAGH